MQSGSATAATRLKEIFAALRQRKWLVLGIALLVTALSTVLTFRKPTLYTAEARVLVNELPTPRLPDPVNMNTEREVVASTMVAVRVASDLGSDRTPGQLLSALTVEAVRDTDVLVIRYLSPDPKFAKRAADSFATNYLAFRGEEALEDFEAAASGVQQSLLTLNQLIAQNLRLIEEAKAEGNDIKLSLLLTRKASYKVRLAQLQSRLDDIPPDETILDEAGQVISAAPVPRRPSSPNHVTDVLVGLLLGVSLGIAAAMVRDRFQDSFHTTADIEQTLGLPVLASVPRHERGAAFPPTLISAPDGESSEAYRALRTSISLCMERSKAKSFLIASATVGEGKSTTVANLGIAFAQLGKRVVLVSADLRRPSLETLFGADDGEGLSGWLTRGERLPTEVPVGLANLSLVTSGGTPANPSELLASPFLQKLLDELKKDADLVLVDSPPLLAVTDAMILAEAVDATAIVLSPKTKQGAAAAAVEELRRAGVVLVGCIPNGFDAMAFSPYRAAYGSYRLVRQHEPTAD